ncbi:unnamed protein product [Linum tenue]|uniref:F-box domain-containing protein n=1 Tax=Linum tenue TaxID=586396 RepID=A0AAV0Q115_9ROSI|nr:unnamed protein product [Linum tenue]CAI0497287.1 unnamed protein product [Linum tenue]
MVKRRCNCGLRKAGKRRRKVEDTSSTTDRLSHLPEPIIYHILSFLDTKSAVRTSKLSRSWSRVWKHVPVLDLRSSALRGLVRLEKFVCKVLSLRYDLNVRKVSYIDDVGYGFQRHESMMVRVIKYAFSHRVQHLVVDTGYDSNHDDTHRFSFLFGPIKNCDHLETLELGSVTLDSGFGYSGFRMLTTLNVRACMLDTDQGDDLDLFCNFPYLRNLILSDCFLPCTKSEGNLRVCGPELVNLELNAMDQFKIEIFTPKLTYLNVRQDLDSLGFSKLTLPSLDHADIGMLKVPGYDSDKFKAQMQQNLTSLFHGVHNARSLKLHGFSVEIVDDVCEFLKQQPPPFKRLECLIVGSDSLPKELIDCFFKGSSCQEPSIVYDL